MSSRLFFASGALAVLAIIAAMLGIWTDDVRWFNTCGAIAVLFGASVFAGIFAAIGKAEL